MYTKAPTRTAHTEMAKPRSKDTISYKDLMEIMRVSSPSVDDGAYQHEDVQHNIGKYREFLVQFTAI